MKTLKSLFYVFLLLFLTSCSSPFITNTSRSAVEQILICSTIEQGISKANFSKYKNKIIKLDYTNLAPQVDKNLIIAFTELHLSKFGIILSKSDKQTPDYIIYIACGVLATDIDKLLLGTPELPIPVPNTDISIVIPEIPFLRRICRSAYGRFYFNIIDAKTLKPTENITNLNAKTSLINWTIFCIPFETYDFQNFNEFKK